jgi:hypothetical protein
MLTTKSEAVSVEDGQHPHPMTLDESRELIQRLALLQA